MRRSGQGFKGARGNQRRFGTPGGAAGGLWARAAKRPLSSLARPYARTPEESAMVPVGMRPLTVAAVPDAVTQLQLTVDSPAVQQALQLILAAQGERRSVPSSVVAAATETSFSNVRRWEQSDAGALALAREYFLELGYAERDISGNILGGASGPVPRSDRGVPPEFGGPGVGWPRRERMGNTDSRRGSRPWQPTIEREQSRHVGRRPPSGERRPDDF